MSNYNTQIPPNALYPGDGPLNLFSAEQPAVPQASQQVALGQVSGDTRLQPLTGQILFSGDPGAFTLLGQAADTDTDAAYQTVVTINAVDANFRTRWVIEQHKSRFFRYKLTARANPVNLTADVSA